VSRRPPAVPRTPGASRYGWFVGVVIVLALAYIALNTARNTDTQSSTGPTPGHKLPPFAAPLALGPLNGDANVATRKTKGKVTGRRYACEVRGPQILNICELAERGPVVLAFLATRSGRCVDELDDLERLRRAYPDVEVAAVAVKGDRDDLRRMIRARGWRFPVGYDRDGALANIYGVAVCPQVTLAARGGVVRKTLIGSRAADAVHLRRELDALSATR
jgi:peroxiredoxin